MDWDQFFSAVGRVAVVATPIGGIALWFAKTYADRWLTKRFQSQLDELKHVQAQEIERLRAKIAGTLDRAVKLHQHEFEVLPEAWSRLAVSMGSSSHVLSAFQRHADVGLLGAEDLESVLSKTDFTEAEKNTVRTADGRLERTRVFADLKYRHEIASAVQDRLEFHNYVILKGIFIEPDLQEQLLKLSLLIGECLEELSELVSDKSSYSRKDFSGNRERFKAAEPLKVRIQGMISERLWSSSKLDA